MSFCGEIIRQVSWLERQAEIVLNRICTIEALEECADYEEKGESECVESREEGYNQCAEERDEGYNECCTWWPCDWACEAFVWISHLVCVAWTWVSSVVCIAWKWITKWICRVIYWVYRTICKLVLGIIFWFIRRVLLWIIFIPCQFHEPELDPRIKHIFVLMLENRAFDHMLGATPIRGTDAETHRETQTIRRSDKAANDVLNEHDEVIHHCVVGTGQKRSVGKDPGHEFGNTLTMLGGLHPTPGPYPPYPNVDNSGFAQNFAATEPEEPCSIMLSYRGEDEGEATADVPVITALAREFVVCDNWFSSMPGPTWPNRLFVHAASSAGMDDSPSTGDSLIDELIDGIVFENGSIYELLDSENIEWSVYHGDAFPQVMALSGMDLGTISTHFHDMDEFEEDLSNGSMANYVFIEPDYGEDIKGNTYKCGNSQHPLDDITHGERLIKRVYETLRNSPVWEESMLIVTYDEGGGFFDHVRPGPTVPPGDSVSDPVNNHHNFAFNQLGVRVPAIVCSPWIPRNLIDHRGYEHASVPSTVEALWGLPNMTERDAHARELTSLLSLSAPRTDAPTALPEAAQPEVSCPEEEGTGSSTAALALQRPPEATLIDPVTLARAAQVNPTAITSTAAAFFQIVLRLDLLLAPTGERRAIFTQGQRFQTMGEVGVYAQQVIAEAERYRRSQASSQRSRRAPAKPAKAHQLRRLTTPLERLRTPRGR
jgi:phospholipase C